MSGPTFLPTDFKDASKAVVSGQARKAAPFSLRLSDKERARLKREADGRPLGSYIKFRLFNGGKPSRSELAEMLGLLGQSSYADSLAILAAEARSGSLLLDKQTLAQIEEACAHVAQMRACLIKALGLLER
ncbi:hypothetical protein [Hoeflea sp.]|uniref:hypothetical protein n=1 Tax=Hoeflea sp. TaxID=1940281 RepID=UPI003B527978